MKISLLICTVTDRDEQFLKLAFELCKQAEKVIGGVSKSNLINLSDGGSYAFVIQKDGMLALECLYYRDDRKMSIGEKRNWLLSNAEGEYLCFLDDDDWVDMDYIELLMEAAESGKDCAGLLGLYIADGKDEGIFEHSIKYKKWETVEGQVIRFRRYPNHLNLIKSSIAKQFKFPEKNFGEDFDWSKKIHEAGVLKTEHYIDEIIYYYQYNSKK